MKQIECLEMEIIVIKISPDKLNSILDTSKEKINQLEDIFEETTQNEVQRERDGLFRDVEDKMRRSNEYVS